MSRLQGASMNVTQAAAALEVHPNTIRNWVRAGILSDVRVPGTAHLRLSRAEIEAKARGRGLYTENDTPTTWR